MTSVVLRTSLLSFAVIAAAVAVRTFVTSTQSAVAAETTSLPASVPIENAEAKAETEMKPYTDVLSGTEVTFKMAPIPGGKFMMGSPDSEPGRKTDEGPEHEVVISPFWMGVCE